MELHLPKETQLNSFWRKKKKKKSETKERKVVEERGPLEDTAPSW